jgi:hypothetical protein
MAYNWDLVEKVLKKVSGVEDIKQGIKAIEQMWEDNKGYLKQYFDENGRRYITVPSAVSDKELEAAFNEGQRVAEVLACNAKYSKVLSVDKGYGAYKFLKAWLKAHVGITEIVSNKLERKMDDPNREGRILPVGTKLTKYFTAIVLTDPKIFSEGTYCSKYGKENAQLVSEFLTDVYSQMVGLLKRKEDKLILSINPLDILFASTHSSFHSCFNIYDGDHKVSPLDLMLDKVTLVGFASREEKVEPITRVPWLYKEWRQLVYIDAQRGGAFFGRENAGANLSYSRALRKLTAELLGDMTGKDPDYVFKTLFTGLFGDVVKGEPNPDPMPVEKGELKVYEGQTWDNKPAGRWHFHGWRDVPEYAIRLKDNGEYPKITAGVHDLPCVCCGKLRKEFRAGVSDRVWICDDCNPVALCSKCGRDMDENEAYSDELGYLFCHACWQYDHFRCGYCNDWADNKQARHTGDGKVVCAECLETNYVDCEHCGRGFKKEEIIITADGKHFCKKCLKEVAVKCEVCGNWYGNKKSITLTKDGYQVCTECIDHLTACPECGSHYMYSYTMIDGYCSTCALNRMKANQDIIDALDKVLVQKEEVAV